MTPTVSAAAPFVYAVNRFKECLRRITPAHRRFVRAGESFWARGEREVRLLPELVEPGSVAVDVGAHIGDYTYSICRAVGPHGRVIAVEPLPDLARMLSRAVRRLALPVDVVHCALSSSDGGEAELTVPMEYGERMAGYATLERRAVKNARTFRVRLRRLDDLCRDVTSRISFIKIDVEGHELQVLAGAGETLRRHRPNLLIEIEQRHSAAPIEQTFEHVINAGYRGEFLGHGGESIPLSEFDPSEHQQSDRPPGRLYVSNFIFRPV
jgi:FkbM family methyltransferase